MRALVLALLLVLLPLAGGLASGEPAPLGDDILVTLEAGARVPLPPGALPISVVSGFIVPHAPPGLAATLARTPGVLRIQTAEPLEWHGLDLGVAPGAPSGESLPLRLIRASGPDAPEVTGAGITLAVVDSGIDATHPDLAGRVKANLKLVDGAFVDAPGDLDGHGTHVAGIAAGSGASSDGLDRGVAPGAGLVGLDISARFTTASALLAYDWLHLHHKEYGIRVVVNAWGRVDVGKPFDADDATIRAIDQLVDDGVVVLFSASNHGPGASSLSIEAQDPRVVTVGAVDAAGRLMDYSSRGPVRTERGDAGWVKPDVVAPGEDIVGPRSQQATPNGRTDDGLLHRRLSGTSQAVPHVAGLVALLLETNRSLTPRDVQNALRASAVDLQEPGPDDATGFGLVDAPDALRASRGQAPRRDNPLAAGGQERYDGAATLAPTAGGLLGGLLPSAEEVYRMPFPVKPGAERVAFDLAASNPAAPGLTVILAREGQPVGTWSNAQPDGSGRAVLRGRVDDPEPGIWTLHVRAAAPVAAQLEATALVSLPTNATRAQPLDPRYVLSEPPGGAFRGELAHDATVLATRARLLLGDHPGVVPTFAAGLLLALAAWRPPRPPRRAQTVILERYDP